jgi:hypothetical protein
MAFLHNFSPFHFDCRWLLETRGPPVLAFDCNGLCVIPIAPLSVPCLSGGPGERLRKSWAHLIYGYN